MPSATLDSTMSRYRRNRGRTKARGTTLRSCTTLQRSDPSGDLLFFYGVKQICALLNVCYRTPYRIVREARKRLRAVKKLEGIYKPKDLSECSEASPEEMKDTARIISEIVHEVIEKPGAVFREIFENYGTGWQMDEEGLRNFLRDVQGVSLEDCLKAQKDRFAQEPVDIQTIFVAMLENDAIHGAVNYSQAPDMTKPLTHYWINSSHNTYLKGRQIGAKTADCGQYERVLEDGCRCVEIDVWESGTQLKVCHRSLTNSLDLKSVFETIKRHAFKISPYPVILSIEQHLGGKALRKMMQCLKDCFKGYLLEDRLETPKKSVNLSLMSPDKLRNCVLIKMRGTEDIQADFSVGKLASVRSQTSSNAGVDKANTHRGNEIISLAESVARSMIDLDADESRRRTRDQLARVYPASFRIDSSNYSPVKMWLAGCHMVALNLQSPGRSVLLNQALFNQYSRSGYVLKPEAILSGSIPTSPVEELSITILSGHRFKLTALPRGACSNGVYGIRASIHGASHGPACHKSDRRFRLDKDFKINTAFKFDLCLPEAAFLEISLQSPVRVGTFCAIVSTLRPGIRFLHLTDRLGRKTSPPSCLLAYIERKSVRRINEE